MWTNFTSFDIFTYVLCITHAGFMCVNAQNIEKPWSKLGDNWQPWAMMLRSAFKLVVGHWAAGRMPRDICSITNYRVRWISPQMQRTVRPLRFTVHSAEEGGVAVQVMTSLHCVFSNVLSIQSSAIVLYSTFS